MKRRKVLGILLVGILLISSLLTGCGQGTTPNSSSNESTGNSEVGTETKVVKLGAVLPLTGGSAYFAKSIRQSIELATEEINASGGIDGMQLEVIFEDDKATPAEGVNSAQKLITQDGVSAIIGAFNSSVTIAVRDLADREKVVLITPGSAADDITGPDHPYMFRVLMPNSFQGPLLAKYAVNNLNFKNIAIISENTDYGRTGADSFKADVEAIGGKIVSVEYYNQGDKDFYAQLTKLKNIDADAILISGLVTEGALILKQARDLGVDTQWLGFGGFANDSFYELVEGAAEGMIHTSYFEPEAYDYFPNSKQFVESYKAKFGQNPDMFAADGYEATYALAQAIKYAGSGDREKIREGLTKIQNYPGVGGPITFEDGQVSQGILFVKVVNGVRMPIGNEEEIKE